MKKIVSKGFNKLSQRLVNQGDKVMDHNEYPKRMRTKTDEELRFIIRDAREAMEANPNNPNNGYYADEINYAAMELKRRQDMGRTAQKTAQFGSQPMSWNRTPGGLLIEVGEVEPGLWIDSQSDKEMPAIVQKELQPYADVDGFLELNILFDSSGTYEPERGRFGPIENASPMQISEDREVTGVEVLANGKKIGSLSPEAAAWLGDMYEVPINEMEIEYDTEPDGDW